MNGGSIFRRLQHGPENTQFRRQILSGGGKKVIPRAVVVDDDPLARERLKDLIEEVPLVDVVGEASTGASALSLIEGLKPDVVFMDIEMPAGTGLEVIRQMNHQAAVIFTTAYNQYAVTAFELSAVDYLLKPFGVDRFREALERALSTIDRSSTNDIRERLSEQIEPDRDITRLFLRGRNNILPVAVGEVTRFEADGDYTIVHAQEQQHLVRLRLQDLEKRLGETFIRVHRSHLLNLNHVRIFDFHDDSRLVAVMLDGTRIVASRARSRELRRLAR